MTRWLSFTPKHTARLRDANWMLTKFNTLLQIQRSGDYQLGEEGYLVNQHRVNGFDRAITMSAWIGYAGHQIGGVLGAKWVSSCVANSERGLPRGEALTILNCARTGLPLLAFDGTDLSNARTAIFACAVLTRLYNKAAGPYLVAFIGAGRVHRWQALYLRQLWPEIEFSVFDTNEERKSQFAVEFGAAELPTWLDACEADVVSIATSGAPNGWIPTTTPLTHASAWINTSLRDITPEMVGRFPLVIVDDAELAASQHTPYHSAVERGIVQRSLCLCDIDPKRGEATVSNLPRPILVNPMGLALWDVGLGYCLLEEEYRAEQQRVLARGTTKV